MPRRPIVLPAVALVAVMLAAGTAEADRKKLSDIAEQAKKPRSEQTDPSLPLSGTKSKTPLPSGQPEPPAGTPPPALEPFYPSLVVPVEVAPPVQPWGRPRIIAYGFPAPPAEPVEVRPRIGVTGSGGAVATDAIAGYGGVGLLLGIERRRWSLDLRGGRSTASFGDGLEASFRDLRAWTGDLAFRAPLTRAGFALPLRVLAGARVGRLSWDLRNPVLIVEDRRTSEVRGDSIGFTALLAGMELEVARGGGWAVATTLTAGFQRFADETRAGFENDVFTDGTVMELAGELVYSPEGP